MISFDSENDFELCLFNNHQWMVDNFGLDEDTKFYRQVKIPPYGTMDILGVCAYGDDSLTITVIELKNQNITLANMAQTARYVRYFELVSNRFNHKSIDIRGVLVGPYNVSKAGDDDVFLAQQLSNIDVYSLNIDPMSGIEAELISGWNKSLAVDDDALNSLVATIV